MLLGVISVALFFALLPFREAIGNRFGVATSTLTNATDPGVAPGENGTGAGNGRGNGQGNGNAGTNQGNGPRGNSGNNGQGDPRRP